MTAKTGQHHGGESGLVFGSVQRAVPSQSRIVPGKYNKYFLTTCTAEDSSATAISTTPFGTCTSIAPISSGWKMPSPPPSIIAGPPIPIFERAVALTTSQHPSTDAFPAKHRPDLIPTNAPSPLNSAKSSNDPPLRTP